MSAASQPSPRPVSALAECLPALALAPSDVPALLAAEAFSRTQLRAAQARLELLARQDRELDAHAWAATATFAFGSLGRLEASAQSDLDLALIYDGARLDPEVAERVRARVVAALADDFDIPQKTFDHAVDLRRLTRNIGGRDDSNETLTYRALLLTEGAWLAGSGRATKHAVFRAYTDAPISRGRFLTSLGNDLHRYYRTLCMDYRYKVDELDKSWAIRVLKLRHSRKLWHLANLALACWAVDAIDDDDAREVALASRIGWPSLLRLHVTLEHFGAAALGRELFLGFDRFLAALAEAPIRAELVALAYERRLDSPSYVALHENAARIDLAAEAVVELLFARCRGFFTRFCLL